MPPRRPRDEAVRLGKEIYERDILPQVVFDVHYVTVLWDGQPRNIEADATGSTPLVGMLLLDRYHLHIEVVDGGRVVIQARE